MLDSRQELIWERGVKSTKNTVSEMETMSIPSSQGDSVEDCIKSFLDYQKAGVGSKQLSVKDSSAYDVLKKYSRYTPVRLTGVTLEDALYYVSKGRPVIAMTDITNAVVIYGYDAFNIMVIDPVKGKTAKLGIGDSAKVFEDAGNIFLSYLEQ